MAINTEHIIMFYLQSGSARGSPAVRARVYAFVRECVCASEKHRCFRVETLYVQGHGHTFLILFFRAQNLNATKHNMTPSPVTF